MTKNWHWLLLAGCMAAMTLFGIGIGVAIAPSQAGSTISYSASWLDAQLEQRGYSEAVCSQIEGDGETGLGWYSCRVNGVMTSGLSYTNSTEFVFLEANGTYSVSDTLPK